MFQTQKYVTRRKAHKRFTSNKSETVRLAYANDASDVLFYVF